MSNVTPWVLGQVGAAVAALLLSPVMSQRAHAFGGLWSSQGAEVRQTAAEIIFVDDPGPTVTAIIRIEYAGAPQEFAWLIPVPGIPTVGVSSNTVFERLGAATAPEYWVEVAVEDTCMPQDEPDAGAGIDGAPGEIDPAATPVLVADRGSVGTYDYVTLSVDRTLDDPAQAATDWLAMNGYDLTGIESELLRPYLADGLNLLAFKLRSGSDAGAIRPVTLTYESKLPAIPILPAAVAAEDDMAIQVWVIGPSQAVPGNYGSLVINDALIDWLSAQTHAAGTLPSGGAGPFGADIIEPSNYDAVVTAAADEAGGQGFVTELGGPASQFRDKVWATVDDEQFATVASESYADGIDAIFAASSQYGGWDGWNEAVEGATTLPAGVTIYEFGADPDAYRGMAVVDTARFLQLLDERVVKPVRDSAALLYRAPYLTRLYTTLSPDEMTLDPSFTYNFDLAQVSNVHVARQSIACRPTLSQHDAPWRMQLPQGGVVVSEGGNDWPVAEGSLPANLKVVMLGSSGSGTVLQDNSEEIGMTLFAGAGKIGSMPALRPTQNGLLIGGTQTVTPPEQTDSMHGDVERSGSDSCSVSRVRAGAGSALAPAWTLAAATLVLRRRRRGLRAAAPVTGAAQRP